MIESVKNNNENNNENINNENVNEGASNEQLDYDIVLLAEEKVKLPKAYLPLEDKGEYMNKYQLAYFKKELMRWRDELKEKTSTTMEHLKEDAMLRRSSEEVDMSTDEIEIFNELRSRDRYRKLIHKIEQALIRIDTGEYGYCERSGEEIGVARLSARPIATLCVAMQEIHEREEDVKEDAQASHRSIMMDESMRDLDE